MEEWIVIQEDEDGDFDVVDKFTGKLICTIYGNTIGEEIDLASRIAKLPEIERERDKLLNWKNETLQVDREWDEQKVGRLLNMKLGDSIRKNIEPKVCQLIREHDEVLVELEEYRSIAENIGAKKAVSEKEKAIQERDEARDVLSEISLYLSVGMGDETTTAKQYYDRILEGIKMLTDPLQDRIKTLEEMFDLQTKLVVDLEMRLLKYESRTN